MFIIEVAPLITADRFKKQILSYYHPGHLPPGSLVEIFVRGKKRRGVVVNSQSIKYLKIRIKKEVDFELKPIIRVLNLNPHPEKDPLDVTLWFPIPEKKPSSSTARQTEGLADTKKMLEGYMEKLAERKTTSKAKNYMQETAEQYLKYINWENDAFEKDMRLFWVSASNYYRVHTHHDFLKILEWIKKKDTLTPKQVAKLFNKK